MRKTREKTSFRILRRGKELGCFGPVHDSPRVNKRYHVRVHNFQFVNMVRSSQLSRQTHTSSYCTWQSVQQVLLYVSHNWYPLFPSYTDLVLYMNPNNPLWSPPHKILLTPVHRTISGVNRLFFESGNNSRCGTNKTQKQGKGRWLTGSHKSVILEESEVSPSSFFTWKTHDNEYQLLPFTQEWYESERRHPFYPVA